MSNDTDLDRRRLAAAAELERFEADERRRLAYADRTGTLEAATAEVERLRKFSAEISRMRGRMTTIAHAFGVDSEAGANYANDWFVEGVCNLLDHGKSDPHIGERPIHDPGGACRDRNCDYEVGGRWSCEYPPICTPPAALADGTGRHSRDRLREFAADMPPLPTSLLAVGESPSVVANVQFTNVPQLCAAYEYALSTLKALYLLIDLKQHAWQPEQEVIRGARRLLLAAGKDVE